MKSHIFDKLAVNNVTCYLAYERDDLIFYGELVRKYKNITNLSWAQYLWQFTDGKEDVVPGLCLLFIHQRNVTYKDMCKIENRCENIIMCSFNH